MRRCSQGPQWRRTCRSRRRLRQWSTTIGPVPMSASTSVACGPTSIVAPGAVLGRLRSRWRPRPAGPGINGNFSTSNSEGIYGFHAGAQWQWGAWVLGAEAALSRCFHECRSTTALGPPASPPTRPASTRSPTCSRRVAAGLCLGPLDDLCHGRLGIGQSQEHVLLDHHRPLRSGGSDQLKAAPRATAAGMPAAASTSWCTRARWSTSSSASSISTSMWADEQAFCASPGCNVPNRANYDLGAKGDLVRAKLTIKSSGYSFLWIAKRRLCPDLWEPKQPPRFRALSLALGRD